MAKKVIKFMCTAFRDGFQSVYGARVLTPDFLPAVEAAREAGITWMEAGGGARFQSLYFYCNEDAFTMMDSFRKAAGPDADLQTLARGINVVGLDSQSSDIIKMHAELFKKHGITTIRNFDALNDVNNLIYSGRCIHEAGLKHQVSVTMMELPPGCTGAHDADFYEKTLRSILDAGIPYDAVCFKDASGTSTPAKVYETVRRARKMLPEDTLIHFHTHETAGCGLACYRAAIEGGADAVDLSLSPVSGGTCQTDVLVMWHALRDSDYSLDVDPEKVFEAERVFKDCMTDYFLPPEALKTDPQIVWSPMPGGALTANTQMLRDNGIMDKYPAIIAAMPDVVERGGYGTSVTPVSQFYFQQAFNNVMFGPWKKIAEGYGLMVLGYYGRTPVAPDPEVVKIASEQMGREPAAATPLEINDADPKKGTDQARHLLQVAGITETAENIFIAATCKEKGIAFLKGEAPLMVRKESRRESAQETPAGNAAKTYAVKMNQREFAVTVENGKASVNGKVYNYEIKEGASTVSASKSEAASSDGHSVKAPMPGSVVRLSAEEGDTVRVGDTLLVIEAMKMEVQVKAPVDGIVSSIAVQPGTQVTAGHVLAYIN